MRNCKQERCEYRDSYESFIFIPLQFHLLVYFFRTKTNAKIELFSAIIIFLMNDTIFFYSQTAVAKRM